jgi:hypothetical protein
MSFVIGIILFVGVIGFLDARLPWPRPKGTSHGIGRNGHRKNEQSGADQ